MPAPLVSSVLASGSDLAIMGRLCYNRVESIKNGMLLFLLRNERFSTDAEGIAVSLGLQADPNVALEEITANPEARISQDTLFTF